MAIIPLSAGIYFLCYLDRSNIGNARILNKDTKNDMQTETFTDSTQFTIALMVFLVAYCVFEVPSNILLKKLRPSRWLSFLMFSWGVITIGLGGTKNYAGITAVRFLLGMFEAGLFPGLVYYLTFWYKSDERSVRVAFILASATLAGAFGGALAFAIGHMNGASGLSAWRWLFIIEGLPSCLSAVFVYFFLPDYPEEWSRFSTKEKDLAAARLYIEGSKASSGGLTWADAKATLLDWRLWGHYAIYFGVSTPFSSLSLFTPTITSGLHYVDLQAQLMTVPPYAVAYGKPPPIWSIPLSYEGAQLTRIVHRQWFNCLSRGLQIASMPALSTRQFLLPSVLSGSSSRASCRRRRTLLAMGAS